MATCRQRKIVRSKIFINGMEKKMSCINHYGNTFGWHELFHEYLHHHNHHKNHKNHKCLTSLMPLNHIYVNVSNKIYQTLYYP
ncbi:Protein C-ets-1, variant 6 [Dermatophagoides farinae]|uniref:Protein C-ets-1, variant 6 n=1 Tax=Dermatophagoides farinae TaxID=6954 RepID=A0A922HPJ6_DERFA|nr:Protein C-ets-1, variant 6 [Dermatophagoides farinae]